MFSPSTRIEYDAALKRLALVARVRLSKAVITGANAFLIDLQHPRDVDAVGMHQSSSHLNWDEKDKFGVSVWVGPMRLVPNGCKTCRNAGYETFSTRRCGQIEPAKTTYQPLAALKVIQAGQRLWGKGPFSNRQW